MAVDNGEANQLVPNDSPNSIRRWADEIELYERETQQWHTRGKKIVRRYKDERDNVRDVKRKFNILWSNTETMRPALYARNPKPDIQRRFKDADPIGRVASDVLERCASYFVDTDHFRSSMRSVVMDYLLPGRGILWLRYVPHMKPAEIPEAEGEITDDVTEGDDDKPQPEVIDYEDVGIDYIHWTDYGHNICRTEDEVWLRWRKVYLDRDECVNRFGKEMGDKIPLDHIAKDSKDEKMDTGAKATIYECWDKKKQEAIWLHRDMKEWLDKRPDPLELENFFPCPKPIAANLANDSLIPVPIYVEYQDQAEELDHLTARIASITKSLKVVGVYDSSAQGLNRLLSEGVENKLLPVDSWAMFAQKGGLDGAISMLPIKDIAEALLSLYEAREKVKADLYEITGIADIIRGQSDPDETMGAQKIKSNFATLRLEDHQQSVQVFVREVIRLIVDIIGGHFQIETIEQISGLRLFKTAQDKQMVQKAQQAQQPLPPLPELKNITPDSLDQMMDNPSWEEVAELIKDATARSFRIDIETDSTIKTDQVQEKADRVEFLKAAGQFMSEAMQAGEAQPMMVPLLAQMMMFGVRAFPIGKELEGAFNTAIEKLEKQATAAQNQPKPNPEMVKVQGELQLAQQKAQLEAQTDARENELEAQREQQKLQMEERLQQAKIAMESDLKLRVAHIDAAAKIEVARITASITDGAYAENREASGEGGGPVNEAPKPQVPQSNWASQVLGMAQAPRDNELHSKLDAVTNHLSQPKPQQPRDNELHAKLDAIAGHLSKPQPDLHGAISRLADSQMAQGAALANLHKSISAEREIVRGKDGKPTGVRIKQAKSEMRN